MRPLELIVGAIYAEPKIAKAEPSLVFQLADLAQMHLWKRCRGWDEIKIYTSIFSGQGERLAALSGFSKSIYKEHRTGSGANHDVSIHAAAQRPASAHPGAWWPSQRRCGDKEFLVKRAAGLLERWTCSSRFKNNVRARSCNEICAAIRQSERVLRRNFPAKGEEFASFYKIYADAFPLADECEPPEAFLEIAALNGRTDVQARYGPWREIVAGIRLRQGEPLAGGIIFGVTTSPFHVAFGCQASVQNIYIFLERAARGKGATASAKSYMENCALAAYGFDMCAGKIPPLIFLEVNNPMRMSSAEIEEDTARSGIDPFRRYIYWKRNGFAPLDLHYVQPPLRAEASAVVIWISFVRRERPMRFRRS